MTKNAKKILSEMSLDVLCINTIRMLSIDMVEKADSGHPGMPMGAAGMAYVLWSRFLRHNPENPAWPDRDRFVLSAGHGSALLYSLLHLSGYHLSLDDIRNFRQWGSKTPGHPERERTPGVEVTTGPLGQGFANGVGMAIAERYLAAHFNRPGFEIVGHFTYAICSDGDLMEGIASEAASLAGHLKLGKLIYLYDSNRVSLAASTRITFTEDVGRRFEAYGWHVLRVEDGNDLEALDGAIDAARKEGARPSLIIVRTHIGYGSPNKQDSFEAHGSPLGAEEVKATKRNLGWPEEAEFLVPERAADHFRLAVGRGGELEEKWNALLKDYGRKYPASHEEWQRFVRGKLPEGWDRGIPVFGSDQKPIATRSAGRDVINAISEKVENLIGGSADLDPSTKTALRGKGSFHPPGSGDDSIPGSPGGKWSYVGPNIAFGVREHAMGGILNGIAAHGGLIPFGATFLIFSDYMRPAMRLAALSRLQVIYVLTHDSVALGEDGPTHQPIEHLASFRAMPNMVLIRPADANEAAEAWKEAMARQDGPTMLVMSRQNLPVIDRQRFAAAEGLKKGAYVLADPKDAHPEIILVATGSEVHLALGALEKLSALGIRARVVSMPSWELFEKQEKSYRNEVFPPQLTARLSIEAASPVGWHKYVGPRGRNIAIDHFGASAPGEVNMEKFGFTIEHIVAEAKEILGEQGRIPEE
jgi:transketolase